MAGSDGQGRRLGYARRQRMGVQRFGAAAIAEPDDAHLAEAAFDRAAKSSVRFDAANHDDAVGGRSISVQVDGDAGCGLAQNHGLHCGANRGPDGLFVHAVVGQHRRLTFSRSAAVAAHGWHDKGAQPRFKQSTNEDLNDLDHGRDASRAHSNGYRGRGRQCRSFELLAKSDGQVFFEVIKLGGVEGLPNQDHARSSRRHERSLAKGPGPPA